MKEYFIDKIKETTPTLVLFIHEKEKDSDDAKELAGAVAAKYAGKINVATVDTSFNREAIGQYDVNEYPTWVIFKEGQELMRLSGKKTESELSEMIARVE